MKSNTQKGREFEETALQWFLSQFSAKLIQRNYRWRRGEIDLIFEEIRPNSHQVELVFVEVRYRMDPTWLSGAQGVTTLKQHRLKATIAHFLSRYRGPAKTLRLDFIFYDRNSITHVKNQIY